MAPIVVLIGAPGAGKTTVGTLLAREMQREFRDTDHDVESATGRRIADIFVEDGESAFRELEHRAVATALADHRGVLALGGGAVTHEATRELLAQHNVVWLRVGLAAAASRVGLNRERPMLLGNVRATLLKLMEARHPMYESVARHIVDTDGHDAAAVAAIVRSILTDGPAA